MYGLDGVQWAGMTEVKATRTEIQKIIAGFANPTSIRTTGPTVEGVKYMTTRAEPLLITLKYGSKGAVFAKSTKALTGCLFDETTTTPARALLATLQYVDYLKSFGY